jgi:hypothetical protein
LGTAKEKSDRVGLEEYLTDFVSKNNDNDKYSNRSNALKKPAGENESTSLSNALDHPKK